MSAKVLLILTVLAAVAYAADTDCPCDPDTEIENSALWSFLKKLSNEEPDLEVEKEQRLDAVLPAVLSPLLECNCLQDKTRRKRKVVSSLEAAASYAENYPDEDLPLFESPKDANCAVGYKRFGFLCVPKSIALDK